MQNREPLLSVCLITYNHGKYIRQAIEGVLLQKTDFNWELIIADDCSTDDTRQILLEFKERYPDIIRLILQEKNVGPAKNWLSLVNAPRTKYIAYFEGDDYWTDPNKLQRQVDFLEANPDFGLVYGRSLIEVDGRFRADVLGDQIKNGSLFLKNSIPTLTVALRTKDLSEYLLDIYPEVEQWNIGDYPLWLWFQCNSKIHYQPEITAVYRVLSHSESKKGNRFNFNLNAFEIAKYFLIKYNVDGKNGILLKKKLHLLLSAIKNEPFKFFKRIKVIIEG